MGYLGNYGGTFGESALTPASNHAEATLVVMILLIREIAVLVHGRFEVRLTAAYRPPWGRHHSAQIDAKY